jgi:hypothetical protein
MKSYLYVLSALLISLPLLSRGADIGSTTLPKDHFNKAHAEIIYESIDRDLDSDGGPLSIGGTLEADALYLRLHTAVGQVATLDFDIGGLDSQGADATIYGGVGVRFLVYDAPSWRIGSHLQVHYAPGIEANRYGHGVVVSQESLDYDLLEVDGGVSLIGRIKLADDLILMPYAGPVFSILRVDGDVEADGAKASFDTEEDSALGLAAGVALQLPEGNTLRVEARLFDGVSFSAAAGIVF